MAIVSTQAQVQLFLGTNIQFTK